MDELTRRKAQALDDILDVGVDDLDGTCLWCGGTLDTVSCGREGHDGCMGYANTGKHEPDCVLLPFIGTG